MLSRARILQTRLRSSGNPVPKHHFYSGSAWKYPDLYCCSENTVCLWTGATPQKKFQMFDNVFHAYLIWVFQERDTKLEKLAKNQL